MEKKISFGILVFMLLISLNTVLSTSPRLYDTYETSEIYLEYPSSWGIHYDESFPPFFTSPDWTEEEGGAVISYAPMDFSSITEINEKNKKSFSEDFIEGSKEGLIELLGDENFELSVESTQIISVSNISSIRIIFTVHTEYLSYKQDSIVVPEGNTIHGLMLVSPVEEYYTHVPYFNHFIDSFIIKNPREIKTDKDNMPSAFGVAMGLLLIYLGYTIVRKFFKRDQKKK